MEWHLHPIWELSPDEHDERDWVSSYGGGFAGRDSVGRDADDRDADDRDADDRDSGGCRSSGRRRGSDGRVVAAPKYQTTTRT